MPFLLQLLSILHIKINVQCSGAPSAFPINTVIMSFSRKKWRPFLYLWRLTCVPQHVFLHPCITDCNIFKIIYLLANLTPTSKEVKFKSYKESGRIRRRFGRNVGIQQRLKNYRRFIRVFRMLYSFNSILNYRKIGKILPTSKYDSE